MMRKTFSLLAGLLSSAAMAQTVVPMHVVDAAGVGVQAGTVSIAESAHGLVFTPDLKGLPPGIHGFHVHEKPSCEAGESDGKTVPALAAGGHYDPQGTKKHGTPWGDGHLGDLPALYVDAEGAATQPVLAPRLKTLAEVSERALMIHAGGDNHSDHPAALGGGGGRIVCGVIR